jgi:CheY-like chemotaxis protein
MSPEERLKEMTILIVEDDEIARMALGKIVQRICKRVLEACNGQEGYEMELKHDPDIVLTDLEMPVMDGMELVERLKARDPKRPVVVVTAFADEAHQTPKADRVITKPVERTVLRETLFEMAGRVA